MIPDNEPLDIDRLMKQLEMSNCRKAVRALLAGNDTRCFTGAQYAREYARQHRLEEAYMDGWRKYLEKLAPMHLRSVGCEEIKPGVWTPKER